MFSQCLVTTVTAFAHQLCAAVKGQLNSLPDYNSSSADASQQWLELIAEKGVCICFTGLLQPSNVGYNNGNHAQIETIHVPYRQQSLPT